MKTAISVLAMAGVLALGTSGAYAGTAKYCKGYAQTYANQHAGGNAIGGAVVGGIGGAVLGGIIGGKGGVGAGAAIGGVGGAMVGGSTWQKFYNQAYYQCINQNAPPPQPVYGNLPPVGSNAWKQQCSYKYKSFNWSTGYYIGYDNQYHLCSLP